jgi:lipid II:glycine glycyltransferase (peptidoglycan interpeptide bridge formation enzyme)
MLRYFSLLFFTTLTMSGVQNLLPSITKKKNFALLLVPDIETFSSKQGSCKEESTEEKGKGHFPFPTTW